MCISLLMFSQQLLPSSSFLLALQMPLLKFLMNSGRGSSFSSKSDTSQMYASVAFLRFQLSM